MAEDRGVVAHLGEVWVDIGIPLLKSLKAPKEGKEVDLLPALNLHPWDDGEREIDGRLDDRPHILARIVIGNGDDIQRCLHRRAHDAARRHLYVRTGRKTGVTMEICGIDPHRQSRPWIPRR